MDAGVRAIQRWELGHESLGTRACPAALVRPCRGARALDDKHTRD